MTLDPQVSAAAASDAYLNRSQGQVNQNQEVSLHGEDYSVFGYKDDADTGFHATAYQNKKTGEIIIAYRGTDPDFKDHTRTAIQDVAVDYAMIKKQVNDQKAAADAFTQEMIDKAEQHGISKDHVFVAGHSLGGTLAEIEAWEHGLHGTTLNAYGAVDLIHGVPRGGNQVTNYVMAGDVVSAGSYHFGEVKVLASVEDIAALKAGRYLDAPPGAPPPNPLRAMLLSDHSGAHFIGEGGMENVLAPGNIAANEARYAQNKAAIDHYREDVHQDRAELGEALRNSDSRTIVTTLAHLSPRLQQQLAEVHSLAVDAPIHRMVEHNPLMQEAGKALDYTAATLRTNSGRAPQNAEQLSQTVRGAGHDVQQKADEVAHASVVFSAMNPLVAAGVALGATAVGYTARADAEGIAQASHFAGQATHAVGQFAADQVQVAKQVVEAGAHGAAQLVTNAVHVHELEAVVVVDATLLATQAGHAFGDGITRADDATRDAVSKGIDAAREVADQAYGALSHRGQSFGNALAPAPIAHVAAPTHTPLQPTRTGDSSHALIDPRHPDNRDHTLYNELHRRIPDASEKRLLQFTDACHTNRISVKNLGQIHLDEKGGNISFMTSWPPQPPATVDLKHPSPEPQQSINHIQQHDQQQAQIKSQAHAQNALGNQQGPPQGPMR